jgi:hypothetical protein
MLTAAELIRRDILAIELSQDDFISICMQVAPLRSPLMESRSKVLMEGPLLDKIKATAKQISTKYGDLKYDLLAKATNKALDLFQQNDTPAASKVISRIAKVGKIAIRNRAVIAVLVGMVGTLVGMASNPAQAAQAAQRFDQALAGNDLDQIIDALEKAGIDVSGDAFAAADVGDDTGNAMGNALASLPPETANIVQRAARALRAIDQFGFVYGESIQSEQALEHFSVSGETNYFRDTMRSHIRITTPDGSVVLSEMTTETIQETGQEPVFNHSHTGVRFRLFDYLRDLSDEQSEAVSAYIKSGASNVASLGRRLTMRENAGDGQALFAKKAESFAMLVATALANKGEGRFRFKIDARGAKVQKA